MNKVKIGGVVYTIEIVPLVIVDGNRNCQGSVDYNLTSILLLDSISEERRKEVLIHEITHAIAHEANIDVTEEATLQFAKVLNQVLRDNDLSEFRQKESITNIRVEIDGDKVIDSINDSLARGKVLTV